MPTPQKGRVESSRVKAPRDLRGGDPDDDAFLSVLGARVKAARKERKLSIKEFAETAEISERYLAQVEKGAGNASVTLLRRIGRALDMRLAVLLEDEGLDDLQLIMKFLGGLPAERHKQVLQYLLREFGADESVRRKRIALIGLRGAGKSTLGSALAKQLRRPFIELDREIERDLGLQLSEIFMLYGQPGYRKAERRCLQRIIESQAGVVVSIGGGVVSDPETFQTLLASCYTIWLKASPTEHMSRVIAQGDMRPMKGHSQAMQDLKNILASREAEYARADAVVDTSGKSIEKSLAALRRLV